MQNIPDIHGTAPQSLGLLNGANDPAAIKKVAKDMEALFAYEMIKVMRESLDQPSNTTYGNDTYMSLFDMELSKLFAERGLGLQSMIEKGLTSISKKVEGLADQKPHDEEQKQDIRSEIKSLLPTIQNARISSGYGLRKDPLNGEQKFHHGLDIPAPIGTDVHAIRNGTVIFSGKQQGYGNVVVIDHEDGYVTKYAHNQKNLVKQGDKVDAGSIIAQVGSTGRSTGPHIHFEVLYKGQAVSPGILLAQG